MEQNNEKKEKDRKKEIAGKAEELQFLINNYKKAHHTKTELEKIETLEAALESSLDTLYQLSDILGVPISLEKIPERKKEQLSYSGAAQALFTDYEVIYYVNIYTGHYIEYSTPGNYAQLKLENRGTDFFSDLEQNIKLVVYEKDQKRVAHALRKESLLPRLKNGQIFSVRYRLVINGTPMYYQSRVAHPESGEHIIIGICSADRSGKEESFEEDLGFSNIAKAMSFDYERIYYIDLEDDTYTRYTTAKGSELKVSYKDSSFFEEIQKITTKMIYKKDATRIREIFQKTYLIETLKNQETISMTYRILIQGKPSYHHLKVFCPNTEDYRHILVCVGNIDEQMQKEVTLLKEKNLTYAKIAETLSRNYFSIFYVNIITGQYMEYSSNSFLRSLEIINSGDDFFADCQKNIPKQIYPEDAEMVLMTFEKDNVMTELEQADSFALTYRLLLHGVPTYVNMTATKIEGDPGHILVGLNNVDAQIRRQTELERVLKELKKTRELVGKDPLTGAKSKHAYKMMEDKLNRRILANISMEFSVVVCDVNNLKMINDTLGHKEGDLWIKNASHMICSVFKHSPVFRIGGDEFVVILQGKDYKDKEILVDEMRDWSKKNKELKKVVVAVGISSYQENHDHTVEDVFKRADKEMYKNKMELKEDGEEIR